jgi:hypothetical protein
MKERSQGRIWLTKIASSAEKSAYAARSVSNPVTALAEHTCEPQVRK